MRALANNKGTALLIALALMALMTVAAITALDRATTDVDLSYNQLHDDQAFYIAEAGAKRACASLASDADWRDGFSDISFSSGTYTVVVVDSNTNADLYDTIIVTSQAELDMAASSIEIYLVPSESHPFLYAMFGDSSIDMRNSALTDSYNSDSGSYAITVVFDEGDVGSNGPIVVYNSADLGGDVSSATEGALSIHPGSNIAGDTSSTAPTQVIPLVPDDVFTDAEATNDNATGISGSYSYDPVTYEFISSGTVTLASGTYYFSSIVLKNSASLVLASGAEVIVYVTGDIELKNSTEVNDGGSPASLQFYTQGDIVLKNSGDIFATFYSPEGFGDLRNSGEFYGSIVARDILVHNSAGFHYDRMLNDIVGPMVGDLAVVAWREI